MPGLNASDNAVAARESLHETIVRNALEAPGVPLIRNPAKIVGAARPAGMGMDAPNKFVVRDADDEQYDAAMERAQKRQSAETSARLQRLLLQQRQGAKDAAESESSASTVGHDVLSGDEEGAAGDEGSRSDLAKVEAEEQDFLAEAQLIVNELMVVNARMTTRGHKIATLQGAQTADQQYEGRLFSVLHDHLGSAAIESKGDASAWRRAIDKVVDDLNGKWSKRLDDTQKDYEGELAEQDEQFVDLSRNYDAATNMIQKLQGELALQRSAMRAYLSHHQPKALDRDAVAGEAGSNNVSSATARRSSSAAEPATTATTPQALPLGQKAAEEGGEAFSASAAKSASLDFDRDYYDSLLQQLKQQRSADAAGTTPAPAVRRDGGERAEKDSPRLQQPPQQPRARASRYERFDDTVGYEGPNYGKGAAEEKAAEEEEAATTTASSAASDAAGDNIDAGYAKYHDVDSIDAMSAEASISADLQFDLEEDVRVLREVEDEIGLGHPSGAADRVDEAATGGGARSLSQQPPAPSPTPATRDTVQRGPHYHKFFGEAPVHDDAEQTVEGAYDEFADQYDDDVAYAEAGIDTEEAPSGPPASAAAPKDVDSAAAVRQYGRFVVDLNRVPRTIPGTATRKVAVVDRLHVVRQTVSEDVDSADEDELGEVLGNGGVRTYYECVEEDASEEETDADGFTFRTTRHTEQEERYATGAVSDEGYEDVDEFEAEGGEHTRVPLGYQQRFAETEIVDVYDDNDGPNEQGDYVPYARITREVERDNREEYPIPGDDDEAGAAGDDQDDDEPQRVTSETVERRTVDEDGVTHVHRTTVRKEETDILDSNGKPAVVCAVDETEETEDIDQDGIGHLVRDRHRVEELAEDAFSSEDEDDTAAGGEEEEDELADSEVVDNGDGTYTRTIPLDKEYGHGDETLLLADALQHELEREKSRAEGAKARDAGQKPLLAASLPRVHRLRRSDTHVTRTRETTEHEEEYRSYRVLADGSLELEEEEEGPQEMHQPNEAANRDDGDEPMPLQEADEESE